MGTNSWNNTKGLRFHKLLSMCINLIFCKIFRKVLKIPGVIFLTFGYAQIHSKLERITKTYACLSKDRDVTPSYNFFCNVMHSENDKGPSLFSNNCSIHTSCLS